MKKFCLLFLVSTSVCNIQSMYNLEKMIVNNTANAVTCRLNGGRFGDCLLSYSRINWARYQFKNLRLLYVPFKYSNELMIHELEEKYTAQSPKEFARVMTIPIKSAGHLLRKPTGTLYVSLWKSDITIDWQNVEFVNQLKKFIAPRYDIELVTVPNDCVSIAVHVRTGGTYRPDDNDKERCPLRFVPDEFYIDQIARIADMYPDQQLYVHIFTDSTSPRQLMQKFKDALNNPRITFGYRAKGNTHNAYVLEDFFSMMQFDCLIRPGSHFSRFVQRLGNNTLVIYPQSFKKINGKKVIDTINIKTRTEVGARWKSQKVIVA